MNVAYGCARCMVVLASRRLWAREAVIQVECGVAMVLRLRWPAPRPRSLRQPGQERARPGYRADSEETRRPSPGRTSSIVLLHPLSDLSIYHNQIRSIRLGVPLHACIRRSRLHPAAPHAQAAARHHPYRLSHLTDQAQASSRLPLPHVPSPRTAPRVTVARTAIGRADVAGSSLTDPRAPPFRPS